MLSAAADFLKAHPINFTLDTNHVVEGKLSNRAIEMLFAACGYDVESSDEYGFMVLTLVYVVATLYESQITARILDSWKIDHFAAINAQRYPSSGKTDAFAAATANHSVRISASGSSAALYSCINFSSQNNCDHPHRHLSFCRR